MPKAKRDRRTKDSGKLDIERRIGMDRREESSRIMLDQAYEDIYIKNYVNAIYPKYPVKVHAFSNMEQELSAAQWAAANLAVADAQGGAALRTLRGFVMCMIQSGFVVKADGTVASQEALEAGQIGYLQTGT
jgi:hypothetical protein